MNLELTAIADNCIGATVRFRLPTGISLLGPGVFEDQYFAGGVTRRYSADIEVIETGEYAIQATVYFRDQAEHFFVYLKTGTANSLAEYDMFTSSTKGELQMKSRAMLAPSNVIHPTSSISGYITYYDDNMAQEIPIRGVTVGLFEKSEGGNGQIDSTYTDDIGFYSFRNVSSLKDGEARSIYVGISLENHVLEIMDREEVLYTLQSPVIPNILDGHINNDYSLDEHNQHRALGHIFNCVMDAHDFLLDGLSWERRKITVKWPYGNISKYGFSYSRLFGGMIMNEYILLGAGREWSRTTVIHEYGHSVMTALYGYNAYELPEVTSERDMHYMYTVSEPGFAMREGWAEFFEALVDDNAYNVIAYIDAHTPNIESNGWWTGSGDGIGSNRQSELVEGAVASILWDIVDTAYSLDESPGVDDDDMSGLLVELWDLMAAHRPCSIMDIWHDWVCNYHSQPESLYCIFRRHGIGVNPPWDVCEDDAAAKLILTSGPYAFHVDRTSATIAWLTDETGSSVVEYGPELEGRRVVNDANSVTDHSVLLSSLLSDTIYEYRVGSTGTNGNAIWSEWSTFRTLERLGIKGDVDSDGEIRANDAALTLPIVAGTVKPTEYQLWAADMNDDGSIRSDDVMTILHEASIPTAPGAAEGHEISNVLLQNFPNPSNPDTWIPYQLAEDARVAISIFDVRGALIQEMDLGYRPAGLYTNRDTAAYWDGVNSSGEKVAGGVYFYSIVAGNFSAVKKLTILP